MNRNQIMSLIFCVLFFNSFFGCNQNISANSESVFKLDLDNKARKFKTEIMKEISKKETEKSTEHIYKSKNGYTVLVIYTDDPSWNGVALIDEKGNELSGVENALYTSSNQCASCDIRDVVTADFNGDTKADYYVQLRGTGNGLAQTSQCILFLSGKDNYKAASFITYQSGADHLLDLYGDGRCFLIVEDLIQPEITLPPIDKNEFPGPTKQDLGVDSEADVISWYKMQQLFFHIYYPLAIKGQGLCENVKEDGRFPMFVSYFEGEQWYGKGETKLLTAEQKKGIWESNPIGYEYPDTKIRHKEFVK